MSDSLLPWMVNYIKMLQSGVKVPDALRQACVSLETFSNAQLNNPAFKAALALADAGIGSTAIDPAQLLRLREAGVTESRAAAYFGMTVDEFQRVLRDDKDLKRVYETGEKRGEAMLQVAQFENAITGDTGMQKHLGEFRLEQTPKENTLYTAKQVGEMIKVLEAQLGQAKVAEQIAGPVTIDGEAVEVIGGDGEGDEDET